MNTMSYRGHTARVEYDERDDVLVGRVLGLLSIVSFHADTVSKLRKMSEAAIKDYLADCEAKGVAPEKAASGKLLPRVPPEVHGKALVARVAPLRNPCP